GELATDGLDVTANGADLRAIQVALLDLRNLSLPDADAFCQLRLRESGPLAQLAQTVGTDLSEHPLLVRLDTHPVDRVLGNEILQSLCHWSHSPLRLFRWSSNRSPARGMFLLYQRFQSQALSPAINMIADPAGSNANSTRNSDRPDEPGLSSFMFLCRDALTVSTMGRPS